MGQHRRFPASFLLIAAILAIPAIVLSFLRAAEHADLCEARAKGQTTAQVSTKLQCK
jgi:predicted LPLAT superfamily acyltransferase